MALLSKSVVCKDAAHGHGGVRVGRGVPVQAAVPARGAQPRAARARRARLARGRRPPGAHRPAALRGQGQSRHRHHSRQCLKNGVSAYPTVYNVNLKKYVPTYTYFVNYYLRN